MGGNEVKHCSIKIKKSSIVNNASLTNSEVSFDISNLEPDDLEIDEITTGQKIKNLFGGQKKNLGRIIFPYLVKSLGLDFVYEMACISSVVGMKVPGKHSLFLNLSLSFTSNNKNKYFISKRKI